MSRTNANEGRARRLALSIFVLLGCAPQVGARDQNGRTAQELVQPADWEQARPDVLRASTATARSLTPALGITPTAVPDTLRAEVQDLIQDLAGEPHTYQRAVERLTLIGPAAKPWLLSALDHPYAYVRMGAVQVLARWQAPELAARLPGLLHDRSPEVRAEAARAIGRLRLSSQAERLGPLLADPQARVRRAAVEALGDLQGTQAQGLLLEALHHRQPAVRQAAAQALNGFSSRTVVDGLLAATFDPDRNTRAFALRSLGQLKAVAARGRIETLTHDRDPFIREEAQQALTALNTEE